ncbi:methyl-accepting chemotaxis sensory transducer with Cache sensor [Desulfovibrio litoralis DSM 11393]|uniref:Methyl-accepting chemotaxis sensory transducer with Cache sensor n=2 Tax=Desulfovibrio litoralis TaxID=466107 RepID=A0A1M7SW57_9BACT|nr:methyl-accepting chemotaxis sensory transducer with Cache sensor [Desulfovibrio litoralis DSM 11393]
MKIRNKLLLITIIPIVFLLGIIMFLNQQTQRRQAVDLAKAFAENLARSESLSFIDMLNSGYTISRQIATTAATFKEIGNTERGQLVEVARNTQRDNPDFLGSWIMFDPDAFDVNDSKYMPSQFEAIKDNPEALAESMKKLYGPLADYTPGDVASSEGTFSSFWVTDENGQIVASPAGENDSFEEPYYALPKQTKKTSFPDIYMEEDVKELVSTIASPIIVNKEAIGVAGVDINLVALQKRVEQIRPMQSGFMTVYAQNGTVIGSIDKSKLGENAFESMPKELKDAIMNSQKYSFISQVNGEDFLHFSLPLSYGDGSISWSFVMSLPMDKVMAESNAAILKELLIAIIGLLAVITLIVLLMRRITQSITIGIEYAEAIASGNLQAEISIKSNDEVGKLVSSLRKMTEWMRNTLSESKALAESNAIAHKQTEESLTVLAVKAEEDDKRHQQVNMLAENLDAISQQLQTSTIALEQQVSQAQKDSTKTREESEKNKEAVGTLENITMQVQWQIDEATKHAEEAKTQAVQSTIMMQSVHTLVERTANNSQNLQDTLTELAQKTAGVGNIIVVISEIADQVNLLALNAAIEAARAGEAGRGFAVVADEVRKLAEKTMRSAQEVKDVTTAIQTGTQDAVAVMSHSLVEITESVIQSEQAHASINKIMQLVEQSVSEVHKIKDACQAQTEANQSIVTVSSSVEHIAITTAEEMQAAIERLHLLAPILSQLGENTSSLRAIYKDK